MADAAWGHFGQWWAAVLWVVMFGLFLAFTPFYRKSQVKPSGVYLAFVVALALEMFGAPLSMYVIAWAFGSWLPDGVLWGHTLVQYIGHTGMYAAVVMYIAGAALIVFGWRDIYENYWSRQQGKGQMVAGGIYRYIRHPQYTGFLLITLGMLLEWATPPLLIMWPILALLYYRLARKEEGYMVEEFGEKYLAYRARTSMFLPLNVGRSHEVSAPVAVPGDLRKCESR